MKNNLDLIVVIPVFNEEKIIKTVIESWIKKLKNIKFKIIIVNDGSTDGTKKIIRTLLSNKLILLNKKNSGHGPSITFGYKAALKLKPKYIFQVDSDDQFYTSDFSYFWKNRTYYDFIIGYRNIRNDPLHRLIITRILRLIILIFFGIKVKDINVPYRLMKSSVLTDSMKIIDKDNNIPNIFLSLNAYKKFNCHTKIIRHKRRSTGSVVLVNLNLIKFCIKSFHRLIILRIKKY